MQRGEVFALKAPRAARGHEQCGDRFGVVVQADELLALSTVIVARPSTRARPASFRPGVTIGGERTRVLVEQVAAVDPRRLGESLGLLGADELREVETSLALVLGLA